VDPNPKQNNYVRFKEKLLAYVLQNYKNALDIVPCIRDYADANKMLFQNAPSKQVIRNAMGIETKISEVGETEEDEDTYIIQHGKRFSGRRDLPSTIKKFCGKRTHSSYKQSLTMVAYYWPMLSGTSRATKIRSWIQE